MPSHVTCPVVTEETLDACRVEGLHRTVGAHPLEEKPRQEREGRVHAEILRQQIDAVRPLTVRVDDRGRAIEAV